MRDLEFRAWDTNNNAMIDDVFICRNSIEFGQKGYHANKDQFVFMQYTGIKDKIGRKIWEGDILKIYDNGPESSGRNIRTVEISDMIDFFTNEYDPVVGWSWKELEIIGNIYESPDLLKSTS